MISRVRTLAAALMAAIVVMGIAVGFAVAGSEQAGTPPAWSYVVVVALGAVVAAVIQLVGYRVPAVSPHVSRAQAHRAGMAAYQTSMILRFALAEAVALVALVLTLIERPRSVLTFVVGAAISLALAAVHVWPSERLISKVEQLLDRDGGRSELAAVLDGSVRLDGDSQAR